MPCLFKNLLANSKGAQQSLIIKLVQKIHLRFSKKVYLLQVRCIFVIKFAFYIQILLLTNHVIYLNTVSMNPLVRNGTIGKSKHSTILLNIVAVITKAYWKNLLISLILSKVTKSKWVFIGKNHLSLSFLMINYFCL